MNCIFRNKDQSPNISAPLRFISAHGHHEARCPICNHLNILADEADVCEHFVSTDEPEPQQETRINLTVLFIVASMLMAMIFYPWAAYKIFMAIKGAI